MIFAGDGRGREQDIEGQRRAWKTPRKGQSMGHFQANSGQRVNRKRTLQKILRTITKDRVVCPVLGIDMQSAEQQLYSISKVDSD